MGLCFGFVLETVLIIQRCFCCCWAVLKQTQGLFSFSYCPASEESGGAQEAGRGHSQDSWPKQAKEIFHTIWCHAEQKTGGAGPGVHAHCSGTGWALVSRWRATALYIMFCIFFYHYYYYFPFLFCPIKVSLSQPPSFTIFPILSPTPLQGHDSGKNRLLEN